MTVKIRLLAGIENPKTKRILRYLAKHIKKQVVVLVEEREVFRGSGWQMTEWVDRK